MIDPTGTALNDGQRAALAGFATLVGGGLAGFAGANAQGGATAAQNEALNNDAGDPTHTGDAAKKGGVLDTLAGAFSDMLNANNAAKSWVQGQVNQFIGFMNANSGRTAPSDPNPLVDANNGSNTPSGTAGATVTPPTMVCAPGGGCVMTPPVASPTSSGNTPSNATFSSNNSGNDAGSTTGGFPTTDAISVTGNRSIDKAQSYESGIQKMYNDSPLADRQYTAIVDGARVNGVADDVTVLDGKLTAVEAKYVDDWSTSIRNPQSPYGDAPWVIAEQQQMISQAQKYGAGFDGGVVYHTNSSQLASYYSQVFSKAGVTNFKFVITPTK